MGEKVSMPKMDYKLSLIVPECESRIRATVDAIQIGTVFWCSSVDNKFRCTDKGSRTIVAIALDQDDESMYNGPPYKVVEHVFDEYDFPALALSEAEIIEMFSVVDS